MKMLIANIIMVAFIIAVYQINLFAIIAHKGFMFFAILGLICIFFVAFKILGNPLQDKGGKDNEN